MFKVYCLLTLISEWGRRSFFGVGIKDVMVILSLRILPVDLGNEISRYCVSSWKLYDFKRRDYLGYQDFD